jgi:hypothetical protein
MTYVSALEAQADPGIVSGSTIERKIMSTKTIYKRIALVAVTALGAGVLSVAPAHAVDVAMSTGPSVANVTTTLGTATAIPVTFGAFADVMDAACVVTFTLSAHTGLTINAATTASSQLTATNGWTVADSSGALTMTAAGTYAATTTALTSGKIVGSLNVTPTLAGVYTGIVTTGTASSAGCANPSTVTTTFTLTVGTNKSIAALTGDGGTPTLNNAVGGVAGPANSISAELVIPTTVSSTIRRLVRVSGDLSIAAATTTNGTGGTNSNTTTIATDKKSVEVVAVQDATAKTAHGRTALTIQTPTAGTFTITVFNSTYAGIYDATAAETITVTVNATAVRGTLSVADSTSLFDKDATSGGYSPPAADEASVVSAAINTQAGGTKVVLADATAAAMPDTTIVSATITGPGVIAGHGTLASATTYGRSIVGTSTSGDFYVLVKADGTPGVATITIKVGTVTVATETVSFFGAVSKYTATTQLIAKADGSTVGDAVVVCAVDAAGIVLPSETIYAFSGDTAVATVATSASTGAAAVAAITSTPGNSGYVAIKGIGCAGFSVTALSQILKSSVVVSFGNATTLAASTVTTTATVNVGSVAATTVTVAFDKASYTPGEAMTATLTFKDAAGRLVGAGPGTGALATTGLVASASIVGAPFFGTSGDVATSLGTATSKLFAPLTAGPVSITGKTGTAATYLVTAAQGITLTATATVSDSATMSALTTLINSLIAKINALNKLVIKIQKKVKA